MQKTCLLPWKSSSLSCCPLAAEYYVYQNLELRGSLASSTIVKSSSQWTSTVIIGSRSSHHSSTTDHPMARKVGRKVHEVSNDLDSGMALA
uniref:Uncharacterized protein n=1 Tax=Oryza rufipogon TaxID=4529 RepID=A0A0E0QNM5_ORYRU